MVSDAAKSLGLEQIKRLTVEYKRSAEFKLEDSAKAKFVVLHRFFPGELPKANTLIVLPPLLDYVVNNGEAFAPLLGGQGAAVLAILGGVNIILRALTTTPIFQKE